MEKEIERMEQMKKEVEAMIQIKKNAIEGVAKIFDDEIEKIKEKHKAKK